MKHIISLIISFFVLYCSAQQSFIDLRGDSVSLNSHKKIILIVFSSVSCHNCYMQLAEELRTINIDTSQVSIAAVANVDKNNTIEQRKRYFNYIQNYFPSLTKQDVYFNTLLKRKHFRLFGKKIDERILPSLFLIDNGRIKHYIRSLYHKNEYNISKDIVDTIIQFATNP